MVLLTWLGLIKFSKEPGKLFQHAACCSNYVQSAACTSPDRTPPEMLQHLHFNAINVSAGYNHAQPHNSLVHSSVHKRNNGFLNNPGQTELNTSPCLFPWYHSTFPFPFQFN